MRRRGMIILFIAVSALIAGGLGWLTLGTLREESERRLSAQRAERAEKERLALWKLDGRFFLPLGLESYRKFEDYTLLVSPPNPTGDGSQYLSPLVAVELPDWMSLHVQFDPKCGWRSPQVLTDAEFARLSNPALELDLANVTDARAAKFVELTKHFSIENVLAQLKPITGSMPALAVVVLGSPLEMNSTKNDLNSNSVSNSAPPYQGVVNPVEQQATKLPLSQISNEGLSNRNAALGKVVRESRGAGQGNYQKVESNGLDQRMETGSGSTPPPPGSRGGGGMGRGGQFGQTGVTQSPGRQGADKDNLNSNRRFNNSIAPISIHLGAMRPIWLTDDQNRESLFILRMAQVESSLVYQGILLDWQLLESEMKAEIAEDFPNAQLRPVLTQSDTWQHQMTSLPVAFDPGPMPQLTPAGWTPLRIGLILAWLAMATALSAAWIVGSSLIDLSERRMRFVSAVTHELRTPLTSLRLYLDMLTNGMITDESKKQEYLATLSHESDRLNQLIENVLDFAKLEKRAAVIATQSVTINELIEQLRETWDNRLHADGKNFVITSTVLADQSIETDPRIVTQIIGNLIDNARKYSSNSTDPHIWLWVKPVGTFIAFEVEDRGPGIPIHERNSIFKPFRRGESSGATGGAGLGLALAKQWSETLGGSIECRPAEGLIGTVFRVNLPI